MSLPLATRTPCHDGIISLWNISPQTLTSLRCFLATVFKNSKKKKLIQEQRTSEWFLKQSSLVLVSVSSRIQVSWCPVQSSIWCKYGFLSAASKKYKEKTLWVDPLQLGLYHLSSSWFLPYVFSHNKLSEVEVWLMGNFSFHCLCVSLHLQITFICPLPAWLHIWRENFFIQGMFSLSLLGGIRQLLASLYLHSIQNSYRAYFIFLLWLTSILNLGLLKP